MFVFNGVTTSNVKKSKQLTTLVNVPITQIFNLKKRKNIFFVDEFNVYSHFK